MREKATTTTKATLTALLLLATAAAIPAALAQVEPDPISYPWDCDVIQIRLYAPYVSYHPECWGVGTGQN